MEINLTMNNNDVIENLTRVIGKSIIIALSKKYELNVGDVMSFLGIETMKVEVERNNENIKEKKEKPAKSKSKSKVNSVILPFCGKIIEDNCYGIRLNHGLYTQCTNLHNQVDTDSKTMLCKTCDDNKNKTSNGIPTYGYITARMEKGEKYRDPKGKSPINYGNLMEKLKITRTEAEGEAASQGLIIPESQFEVKKTTRGRPKKDTSAVDSSDNEEDKDDKDDKGDKGDKKTQKDKKDKGDKKNQKVSKNPVNEKKTRGRPKKEKQVAVATTIDEKIKNMVKEANTPKKVIEEEEEEEEKEESDDEDAVEAKVFIHDGIKYWITADNKLYHPETHVEMGIWDDINKQIIEIDDDDD